MILSSLGPPILKYLLTRALFRFKGKAHSRSLPQGSGCWRFHSWHAGHSPEQRNLRQQRNFLLGRKSSSSHYTRRNAEPQAHRACGEGRSGQSCRSDLGAEGRPPGVLLVSLSISHSAAESYFSSSILTQTGQSLLSLRERGRKKNDLNSLRG